MSIEVATARVLDVLNELEIPYVLVNDRQPLLAVFCQSVNDRPHVRDALPCQPFNPWRVIEHFDRNPAVVASSFNALKIGTKSSDPKPGPWRLGSLAWKWASHWRFRRIKLDDRRRFGGHRLAIEVQLDLRRTDAIDQFHGVGGGEQEVRFLGTQRLQGQYDAVRFQHRKDLAENLGRVGHSLGLRHSFSQVSLQGRTQNHYLAAKVAAQQREIDEVIGRTLSHCRVRAREMKTLGLCQQPVQAHDFQSGRFHLAADRFAPGATRRPPGQPA